MGKEMNEANKGIGSGIVYTPTDWQYWAIPVQLHLLCLFVMDLPKAFQEGVRDVTMFLEFKTYKLFDL